MTRYCIIGAGAAGISALAKLRNAGYDADCFEKTDRVGGHWHTDYDALHLITARDQTLFEGFPMPADYPHFPRRDQVREYMESFARHHGLYDVIRFGIEVTSVTPITTQGPTGSAGWTVELATGERIDYDGVLVANGHLWDQKTPSFRGSFSGTQIHSGSYRNTDDLAGDRVLVVGAGNSGCDIASDAAQHRLDVEIVIREGIHFQPKSYFGGPRQVMPWLAQFSPEEQDFIARMLARITLGEWRDYPGMPEPKATTLAEGRVTVNDQLMFWIQHGRVKIRPGISSIDGTTVHFEDGSAGDYDSIIWAIGYNVSLPFLADALVKRSRGVPLRYGGGLLPKGLEKLYYIGLTAPRGPQIPVYGMQTDLAVQVIALHESQPAGFAAVSAFLAGLQEPDDRIDIVRQVWIEQLEDTERLLGAYASARKSESLTSAHV